MTSSDRYYLNNNKNSKIKENDDKFDFIKNLCMTKYTIRRAKHKVNKIK